MPEGFRPYAYFSAYLKSGYYPFAMENHFEERLTQMIHKTLEVDIPQYTEMTVAATRKMKHLMTIISESVPFKPNINSIAQSIGVSRNLLPDWFAYMEKAGLIEQLRDDTGGFRNIGKVEKIYLDNTNLAHLLSGANYDVGNVRETFFLNQMRVNHQVVSSVVSDFQIGERIFEVGGKNKKQKQIAGVEQAFVVKDDIEMGYMNVVPLWLFGLNY